MLLERLHIEAFRGIRNPIDIPLDASITVLLAANGTAKTSVCDAAEWLMTGRVRRLQPGLVSAETLLNRYATSARVLVHATANWANATREIERTEPDSLQIPNARGAARKPTATAKFLEQITPQYVGQTSRSRNVEEPRAEWLRAVRFFNPDGLALLLDDGEDAERIRGIAFAELLGVGPVGRRIEGLKGVRAQIDSPRTAIANVLEKITLHEARLKAEQASVSGPYFSRVDTLLREVAVFFTVTLPETLLLRREALLSLRERLTTAERAMETQRAEYAKVNGAFAEYELSRSAWRKWLEEQKPVFEKALREAQNERDVSNREIRRLVTGASELANRLGQINVLLGQTQTAVATVRIDASAHDSPAEFAAAQTRAARDEAVKKAKSAQVQLERWRIFADEFPQGHRAFLQLDLLGKHRLELAQSIPSAEDHDSVERRLQESTLSLTQLRQQLNSNIDRWQRWGAEVKAQAPNWTKQSACPLCGHDHESPEQLRAAMDDVLSQQPSAAPEIANRLAELESTVAELRASAATITERRRQLLELEKKLTVQKAAFARFLVNAKERGFDEQLFARADAAEVVGSRVRVAEESVTAAQKLAEHLTARAEEVERWHSDLNVVAQNLRAALPADSGLTALLASDPSLDERFHHIEAQILFAQKQIEALRAQTEQANRSAEERRAKLATLDASIRHQQESFTPLAKNADDAKKKIESVEEAWRAISTEPLDSSALVRAAAFQQQRFEQISTFAERLAQAEQHLALAEQAMRDEADRSEAGKAIAANKNEHAALLRVELLRTKLDSAIEAEEQHLNRLLSTQIRPLLRAISSFYLRTQGNPFIDSIGVDDNPNRNVLRWLGQLVDAQDLSAVEMSQGQRQDLALSIFLARARRERGTFILDEPLAHLDDLNRVAFFDTLRAMVAETNSHPLPFRLVITTASWSLVRHLRAKFSRVEAMNGSPAFRVLELVGDPRAGIEVRQSS